ncbi:MFS transporter [Sphingomonas molluscorum]|uniref:MFS transporter n=1 Tax=Sphingomonas molluscorum TaxID=418184 RepID=UPI0031D924DD
MSILAFLKANFRWLACGFLLTLFSSFGQTFFIGLSGHELRRAFDLTGGGFGFVYMAATLASALTLPWLGRLLDIYPAWKFSLAVIPALALSCLFLPFARTVPELILSLYLLRLFGQGMMTEIAYTMIGKWFVANRGRAVSLIIPGHQTGEAILPLAFVAVSTSAGWQTAWFGAAAAILFIACPLIVALLRIGRIPQAEIATDVDTDVRHWTQAEVMRDPTFWLLLVGVLAPSFIGTAVFFHQDYLVREHGTTAVVFAASFPIMAVTTIVFSLVSGALIDRFGAIRLLPFFLLPLMASIVIVALVTPAWAIYLFMLLFGVSYGFSSTLLGAIWPEIYGTRYLGGVRALTVSAMVLTTSLGPGLVGAFLDRGVALSNQLLWMAAWCAFATVVLSLVSRRLRRSRPI